MASFGEALVSGFNATYGTLARGALQAEQAAYFREQREGGEEFRRRDEELRRQYGIDAGAAPQAPQATQPQQAPGPVQSAVGAGTAQAAPVAPAMVAQPPTQGAVATAAQGQPAQRQPPVSPEDMEALANRGDAVTQAALAGQIAPPPSGMPGQVNDTRAPAALAAEVAQFSGAKGPLTRANWNAYYEARINDAMRLLPPDQAVRTVAMLDGLRQRGFGQAVSLAVAASQAGDAEGATRALTAASNFLPDGFKDTFRVVNGGRAIEMVRTPETGEGRPQSMIVPLNEVTRYATAMLDPKWTLNHYLDVRRADETARSNRVREGQTAESLRLTREDRTERRELDLNSANAIESARAVASAEIALNRAMQSGDQDAVTRATEALTEAERKDAEIVGRGLNTRGATGRTAAAASVRSAAQREETIRIRGERVTAMNEIARESLAATAANRAEVNARGMRRLDQYDRRLDQHSLALELRFDVEAAKRERDSARDEESKRVANEKLRIAEERLQLATRAEERRGGRGTEVPAATRSEINRVVSEGGDPPINPILRGSASEAYLPVASRNPQLLGGDVVRLTNDLYKDPSKFDYPSDFSYAVRSGTGSRINLPDSLSENLREWARSRGGGASNEPRASQEGGRGQTSMVQPSPAAPANRATPLPQDREPRFGDLPAMPASPEGGAVTRALRSGARSAAESVGARERQRRETLINTTVDDIRSRYETIRPEEVRRMALRIGGVTPAQLMEMARR